jgi:GMP synthase (glutamine-hydrolysing)
MPTALVVQHVAHESAGWLDDVLDEGGVDRDVRRMWLGEDLPAVTDVDALVVLGGPMGATDDADAPWLADVRALLRAAVDAATPTLAVCLGAQLLAVAAGGSVVTGTAGPELGLCRVTVDAADDPLLGGLRGDIAVVQWHWDHVAQLPSDAVPLASSERYAVQAFRVGSAAWGLQFHPEVTLPLVAQWAQNDKSGVLAAGLDPTTLVGAVAEAERSLLETWTPVLERFARLVNRQ